MSLLDRDSVSMCVILCQYVSLPKIDPVSILVILIETMSVCLSS